MFEVVHHLMGEGVHGVAVMVLGVGRMGIVLGGELAIIEHAEHRRRRATVLAASIRARQVSKLDELADVLNDGRATHAEPGSEGFHRRPTEAFAVAVGRNGAEHLECLV